MNFSEGFIRRPIATILFTVALLVAGYLGFRNLPVSNLPNVDFPTISVSASLPGASPELMAAAVATPLEREFTAIPGLDSINSSSTRGSTQLTLTFNLARNIDAAAADVQVAIAACLRQLPPGMPSPPTFHKVNPSASAIMFFALRSNAFPLSKVDEYAETLIAPRLSMLDGVAQVGIYGAQKYAVRIRLDPYALQSRGVGLDDVAAAIDRGNVNVPGGALNGPVRSLTIEANGQLASAAAFRRLTAAYRNGSAVHLGDLGIVEDSVENDQAAAWFNGQRAIMLAIDRQPGSNTIKVADSILALLPTLRAQIPAGVDVSLVYNRAETIRASVHDVQGTLGLTIILVIAVIFLFLRSPSATFIPSMTLPASIIGTFGVMALLGFSLDNLSLMALTLSTAFVVDDAIVVLENIVRHVQMGETVWDAALKGSKEISFTVVSMTTSLVAVFIPVLFMGGVLGRLFNEFGVTISVAILVSGAISLVVTPMLASLLLKPERKRHGRLYNAIERAFEASLNAYMASLAAVMRHRRLVIMGSGLILALAVALFVAVPKGFIPPEDTDLLMVSTEGIQGISFLEMVHHQQQVAGIISHDPAVAAVMSSAGAGGPNASSNSGRLFVRLKPRSQRGDINLVVARLRKHLTRVVGIRAFVLNPPTIRIGGISSKSQYQVSLQGLDAANLYQAAPKLVERLRQEPMLQDVNSDQQQANPQVKVDIDREQAAALGLSAQSIEAALQQAFAQVQVSTLYGSADQYKALMDIEPQFQTSTTALAAISVHSSSGKLVPLGAVARFSPSVGPVSVNHIGPMTAVTLSFDTAPGVSLSAATAKVREVAQQVLPDGITLQFQGAAKAFEESTANLGLLLGLAVLVIYLVLGILYESFIHPLTVLSGLPSAGLGALVALLLFHKELDIYGFVGLIMLIGIVKKNAIIMIDFAIARQREVGAEATEAILAACRTRYRPIMMTTMAALMGTLPISLGLGAGGEARQTLGLAVVGGLLVSQLLTLYITPVVFVYLDQLQTRVARRPRTPEPVTVSAET